MLLSSSCWKVLTSPDLTACTAFATGDYLAMVGRQGAQLCLHLSVCEAKDGLNHGWKSHDRPRHLTIVGMVVSVDASIWRLLAWLEVLSDDRQQAQCNGKACHRPTP